MAVQFDSAPVIPTLPIGTSRVAPSQGGGGFAGALEQMLKSVDTTAGAANDAVTSMVDGTGDVHDAMIALQRAESTLQLTVQVRNKLLTAYQEIMRMPV